ncbi:M36 family metallopeptidase, partial [Flavobacteriaceae bacterium]|nr:M36 family metallopeptidase [Flavobacteriaceae bacterium]
GQSKKTLFNNGGISEKDIPVKLLYHYAKKTGTRITWELSIKEIAGSNWWNFQVDASTGEILHQENWTVSCNILGDHNTHNHSINTSASRETILEETTTMAGSYNVYPMPVESPNYGNRALVSDPENAIASPFGWHDTNGSSGAEFTITRGNNTHAYEDGDNPGYSPEGGAALIFDFPINETYSNADQSEDAVITNLFYWNNIIHDVVYQYGFDEAAGNFQENNYGNGGAGSDYVNAEAQDGSGTCNANFGTPPDGGNPTMQMYVCGSRDGDLDNGVIIHEYGHGISNRLTGGAAAANCLQNEEQMGEGWSDYYALMMTIEATDAGTDARPIGTWLTGSGPNGASIRTYDYSTDFGVNPHTYSDITTESIPHGVGSVWAAMLWDMTWKLIDTEGFDPDTYNGSGGNNTALVLVTEAMKLQPCSPGMVDGRDAIIAADQAIYGGAHLCEIWEAFAARGLGFSADQGSTNSRSDGTQAFDLPPTFSSFETIQEVCLADGLQTGLGGGAPTGGVYSGIGVTDDGNGTTYTFDPSVNGSGAVTIQYAINDFCTGLPGSLTDTIQVTDQAPEISTLTSPINNDTDVSITPSFSWDAISNASSYDIEIATDVEFNSIIATQNITTNSYTAASLNQSTTYYWRVKANNSCGEGDFSSVSSFTTQTCSRCASEGTTQYNTSTTRVIFNTIDNATGKPAGYSDYTNISTAVNRNTTYDLTVQVNTDGNYQTGTLVWIDWNQNCDFDDTGEQYNLGVTNNQNDGLTSLSPLSILIPSDASLGQTVMRVSTQYNAYPTSCLQNFDGEVEDYTLNVIDPSLACNGLSTTWNGSSWSNGIPDADTFVIIDGAYNTGAADTGSFDACALQVDAALTVA